jgi:CubicO group peptidase (beta-lactamase class C family)
MDWQVVEGYVFEKMRKTNLPGLSIAAVKDGEVVYARGFGFRDVESGAPMTTQTRVGIGSVTKSFTALAVMMLAEEGKLSLDDPIDKFVPISLRPFGEPVRLRHLLTHSSGIPALAYA